MASHKNLFIKQWKEFANVANFINKANRSNSWALKWKAYVQTINNAELVEVGR